jgi:hypothetical protein
MTLTTENDVGWFQASNTFERDVVKWLDEDLDTGNESAENRPNFPRARSLAVDRVVYEID